VHSAWNDDLSCITCLNVDVYLVDVVVKVCGPLGHQVLSQVSRKCMSEYCSWCLW